MSTYVSKDIQESLDQARLSRMKRKSRLRAETSEGYCKILRLWDTGFSVAAEDAPNLRGYVDIYEGPTQMFQCLIIASSEEAGEMSYEFKRMTAVANTAARDFAADTEAPVGFIGMRGQPI